MKQTKKLFQYLFAVCIAVVIMGMTGIDAKAYGVTQTAQTQNSITITWQPKSSTTQYYLVKIADSYDNLDKATPVKTTQCTYTFSNLQAGTKYYVDIDYAYTSYGYTYTGSICSSDSVVTLPGKVTNVNQVKWWYYIQSVDIQWDRQTGVNGYEYIMKDESGKTIANGTKTYYSGNSLSQSVKNNTVYNLVVRAYSIINGQKYYGEYSDKAYFFTQPMVKSAKINNGKLELKWEKVRGVTSYDIYISNKEKTGYKKVKTVGKNKTSVKLNKFNKKKFVKGKKYYVYIVANKKVGKNTYTSGRLYSYDIKKQSLRWSF